ncbi:hypothetical protein BH23ACT7_BH23ACT7_09330 [soil metagenome]
MRWLSVLLLTAVLLLVPAGPARAHVELELAAPAPGEVVTEAFARVTLTFSGALLEGGEHAVGLFGPDERELDDLSTVTESDRVLSTGVASPPAEGTYTMRWRIFAADGDQQDGSYSFTYAGPVAAETSRRRPRSRNRSRNQLGRPPRRPRPPPSPAPRPRSRPPHRRCRPRPGKPRRSPWSRRRTGSASRSPQSPGWPSSPSPARCSPAGGAPDQTGRRQGRPGEVVGLQDRRAREARLHAAAGQHDPAGQPAAGRCRGGRWASVSRAAGAADGS